MPVAFVPTAALVAGRCHSQGDVRQTPLDADSLEAEPTSRQTPPRCIPSWRQTFPGRQTPLDADPL